MLTAKSHTAVTPLGDYTYSKVTPPLLLQVIILTARIVSDMLSTQNLKGSDDIC
jgi:hypothetical protein